MNIRNLFFTITIFLFLIIGCNDGNELLHEEDYFISSGAAEHIAERISGSLFGKGIISGDGLVINLNNTQNNDELSKIASTHTINDKTNKPAFYIMNFVNGGYVILSADIRMGPVLSISEIGAFEISDDYPAGLNNWMNNVKEHIDFLRTGNYKVDEIQKQAWDALLNAEQYEIKTRKGGDSPLAYLEIQSLRHIMNLHWNHHGEGYNDSVPRNCPDKPGGKAYAGCVPVTIGQILRHWKYPKTYDWDNMPTTHATPTTASFLVSLGEDMNVYYTCNSGSGSSMDLGYALRSIYGYNAINDRSYTYEELKNEIDNIRPVVLSGPATLHDGNGINHAWICEGYMEYLPVINSRYTLDEESKLKIEIPRKMLFMNWGWNEYNGWYSNDKLMNGAGRFYISEMIKNIYPAE